MVVHDMETDGSASEAASSPLKKEEETLIKPQKPKNKILPAKLVFSEEEPKRKTTKIMIHEALNYLGDLEKRKGVSMYAIKKYLKANFNFNTEKNKFLIKNALKAEIDAGKIVQTKGIGVTGSFKLVKTKQKKKSTEAVKNTDAPAKKTVKKKQSSGEENLKKKKSKTTEKRSEPPKKEKKKPMEKSTEIKNKSPSKKEESKKKPKIKMIESEPKPKKKINTSKKDNKVKSVKMPENSDLTPKKKKVMKKGDKSLLTPAQKKLLMKRRSSGKIIKPPKMKPKAK